MFACCWIIVAVVFFSLSQSKLPGYILPAVPAGALLLAAYLRQRFESNEEQPVSRVVIVLHAIVGAAPIAPALLIGYLVMHRPLPTARPMFVVLAFSFVLAVGIALTLVRKNGLRVLRFVTLIPVVLTVGIVLKLGSRTIDETLSARPVARELASIETHRLPLAVYDVPRELEYGLTFYRNQLTFNYRWGKVPPQEHLLVAPENSQLEVTKLVPGRRVSFIGEFPAQHVDYFWIGPAVSDSSH
jgi:4-amino-4-deoxy-L-arabinose transferase-like glycosyltransferase